MRFCVRVRVSVMGSVSYLNENLVVYILCYFRRRPSIDSRPGGYSTPPVVLYSVITAYSVIGRYHAW